MEAAGAAGRRASQRGVLSRLNMGRAGRMAPGGEEAEIKEGSVASGGRVGRGPGWGRWETSASDGASGQAEGAPAT